MLGTGGQNKEAVMRQSSKLLSTNFDRIPMFGGRPQRQDVIHKDDILNLVIALEIHPDVVAFCADKHLFNSGR